MSSGARLRPRRRKVTNPMFEITIAPLALQNIEDEIFKRGRDIIADGGEVGGFLWSQKGVDWWSGLNIQIAGDAGPNAEHGFRMINFDMPYFHEMNARSEEHTSELQSHHDL